ncbi:hypothetical protein Franean1_2475 [Parafrankia sp. EAN1pec]|nr:hypothetical protein Franean1_2475 [Frankia sp. EAN1pec]
MSQAAQAAQTGHGDPAARLDPGRATAARAPWRHDPAPRHPAVQAGAGSTRRQIASSSAGPRDGCSHRVDRERHDEANMASIDR